MTPDSRRRLISAGNDDATTAADDLDVVGAGRAERLHEVLEVLDVPALVGRDGDALRVLLERGVDDLCDGAVVPEVDHLAALAHEDAPHDVDRGVVAVEERGRRHEAHGVLGHVSGQVWPSDTRRSCRVSWTTRC